MSSYSFHINLYDLAFLGAIFIGLTFALLLWFTKTVNRPANRFLALALLTMILWMTRILAIDIELRTYLLHWDLVPTQFLLALGPLLYFYVLKITNPKYNLNRKDLLHFSPLLLEQVAFSLEIKESVRTDAATYVTDTFRQLNPIVQLLIFISVISYLHLSRKLIQRFYRNLQPVLMDRPLIEFRWLRRLLTATIFLWFLWIFCAAVDYLGYRHQLGTRLYYPFYVCFVITIIWTAAAAFLKPQAAVQSSDEASFRRSVPLQLRAKGVWLKRVLESNKYYQEPELSLSSLGEKLKMSSHELSKVINTVFKKSFTDFINEYRVKEVVRKMQDPANDRITLLGIAFEAGFNSKTSFNRIFKQMTGKSPTEYKDQLENERPFYNVGRRNRGELLILNHKPLQRWVPGKLNSRYMFRNYVKIAWRNLIKNKIYSIINISGLAVGMTVAMLIGLWIYSELSPNKHFKNYDSLYQVIMHQTNGGEISTSWVTPFALGEELKSKYSEIKAAAMCDGGGTHLLETGDKKLVKYGFFIGEDAVNMFSLDVLYGDKNPLHDPYSIVLTDETAKALFNTPNAIGHLVKLDNGQNLTVRAIVAKQPKSSSIVFDYLLPWKLQGSIYPDTKKFETDWGNNSWQTFVQLNDHANTESVNAKIKDVVLNHFSDDRAMQAAKPQIEMFPMWKWKLYTDFENGRNVGGYIRYVRLFGILGFVVLLIAAINFMNLSTARSSKRAKEIGIRKVVGSLRKQLVVQFFSESILITILAFVLSLVIVLAALPYFNKLTSKEMSLFVSNFSFWSFIIAFTLLTGLIAGIYPAIYLSSFNPARVLKGKITGRASALPRKVLVVTQFTSAVVLMIGTIIIYQQIQHGKDRPIGYNKNGLISVSYSSDMSKKFEALQNDLLATGAVYSICKSNSEATEICCSQNGWEWLGSKQTDKTTGINTIATEYNFTKTFGIKMLAGRDFSLDYATDSTAVLLNEAAVKLMQLKDPVGKVIKWNDQSRTIIGVIPDLQMQSPFQSVAPMIIKFSNDWVNAVIVRINPSSSFSRAITIIKPIFERYNEQFDYHFADESYEKKFNYEELVANLAAIITVIAIFISCLGLFGLSSYMAEQRTKEIGVRRVLGAKIPQIWGLLSKDFVALVLIACAIAIPIAWYLMNNWLNAYEYRINLGFGVFLVSIAASVTITLLTVSFHAIKAATANPVKSLRTE